MPLVAEAMQGPSGAWWAECAAPSGPPAPEPVGECVCGGGGAAGMTQGVRVRWKDVRYIDVLAFWAHGRSGLHCTLVEGAAAGS
jgi:hypothetical protein